MFYSSIACSNKQVKLAKERRTDKKSEIESVVNYSGKIAAEDCGGTTMVCSNLPGCAAEQLAITTRAALVLLHLLEL